MNIFRKINKKLNMSSMEKQTYAYVQYKGCKQHWIYKCNNSFNVGDIVEVPTFNGTMINIAIIKRIVKLTDKQLPIQKERLLTIFKKLNYEDYEKDFYPIKFMQKKIDKQLIKDWHLAGENNWVKFYQPNFEAEISYEKDGVFICSLNNILSDDYFQADTITSKKKFINQN